MKAGWICDSCGKGDTKQPWACPSCGYETCEHCFAFFAHCKTCAKGRTDEELIASANRAGFYFEPTGGAK